MNPKLNSDEVSRLLAMQDKLKARYRKQTEFKNKTYDIVTVNVPKGTKDIWRQQADLDNKSLARFVSGAVDFYINNK